MSTAPGQVARKGPGTGHVALTETRPPEEGGAHGLVWGLYLVLLAWERVLCPGGGAAPRLCLGHQEGMLSRVTRVPSLQLPVNLSLFQPKKLIN